MKRDPEVHASLTHTRFASLMMSWLISLKLIA